MGNSKLIFMAGGGTAGHVYPNLALIEPLKAHGIDVIYLGKKKGLEYGIVTDAGIPFREVNSERFFRYLTLKTLLTPPRVLQGIFQTVRLIHKEKPAMIFCKGGFGSLPPAIGGWLTRTPVVLHESDMTPGLANKLCMPFAKKLCVTFADTMEHLPKEKAVYTGTPIRASLLKGNREKGFAYTGLDPKGKPVLMVVGGSSGAHALNEALLSCLDQILEHFQVIHLYGSKQEEFEAPQSRPESGYYAKAYAKDELVDLFAMTDLVLSRAGSNAINELLLLKKPNVLVPLPLAASRGDQILNAEYFAKQGFSAVLRQEDMTSESLLDALMKTWERREDYIQSMSSSKAKNGTQEVLKVILEACDD
ncbi:MAG: undecaprenyldiphospho-muramoylpentapeptide beta-N-acetylglucosaminyltransferase [Firmicutes bacterium]|nr:undecaprenyldiphospho-muramoylpentapeptide beta-N-acetylglucosaminyltransferase [Bacillota bacterium]